MGKGSGLSWWHWEFRCSRSHIYPSRRPGIRNKRPRSLSPPFRWLGHHSLWLRSSKLGTFRILACFLESNVFFFVNLESHFIFKINNSITWHKCSGSDQPNALQMGSWSYEKLWCIITNVFPHAIECIECASYDFDLKKSAQKNTSALYVGLPKFFGVSFFKLQTWDWPKSWRYNIKFQVPPEWFYHFCRAHKTFGFL